MALQPLDLQPADALDEPSIAVENIRFLMSFYKVSQLRLSAATGISQSTLSTKLAGHSEFKISELSAIAAEFSTEARPIDGAHDLLDPALRSRCSTLELVDFRSVVGQLELIDTDGRGWNQSAELTAVG